MTRRIVLVGLVAVLLVSLGWSAEEPLTQVEREKLRKQAAELGGQAVMMHQIGKSAEAVGFARESLAIRERLYPLRDYPNGHPELITSLSNLGVFLQLTGEFEKALPYYERVLSIRERMYSPQVYKDGHPDLALSLNNLGTLFLSMGEHVRALAYFEKALAMKECLYPVERYKDGHPDLALSLNNLGTLLKAMGEYGKALPYYEKALAMNERYYSVERYKDGHAHLAGSLNNLGELLRTMREHDKALPYLERALSMRERLYPVERNKDGHPDLAESLGNLGSLLHSRRESDKALACYEKALAMQERLYPPNLYKNGHPKYAYTLNGLGALLQDMGENDRAFAYFEKALAMRERLYSAGRFKHGHPDLTGSLNNLGFFLHSMGKYEKAYPYLQKAAQSYAHQVEREASSAPESQALALLRSFPGTHYGCLSAARRIPGQLAEDVHSLVWPTKGALLDLLTRRHQSARADTSPESQALWKRLIDARRLQNRLAIQPLRDPVKHEERLVELTKEVDEVERELSTTVPDLPRRKQLATLGPKNLLAKLEPGTAFIDVYHHAEWEKGTFVGYHYQAFVLSPGRDIRRIDLGSAKPIHEAIDSWRHSLGQTEDSLAPARLKEQVWDKLAAALPRGTKVVYLCPDGNLARLPWPALRGIL